MCTSDINYALPPSCEFSKPDQQFEWSIFALFVSLTCPMYPSSQRISKNISVFMKNRLSIYGILKKK